MMRAWQHFQTITNHKRLVMVGCFKVGLFRQGLLHDLSKYGIREFWVGCKYYRGDVSPNTIERMEKGYTAAWLHHKGRNKHHLEYWIDYGVEKGVGLSGMKMPLPYVVEMFIDRMAACKNYQKEQYSDASPWQYYQRGREHYLLHPDTRKLLERLLLMLWKKGEAVTFSYIRKRVLTRDYPY
jgi:hypothetical protein